MSGFIQCNCAKCGADNSIEASAADVLRMIEVNCSRCGNYLGDWGDLLRSDTPPDMEAMSSDGDLHAG
jgi:endogenous inhibitor of DNA gyrase (YacG/DUF329 family)